MWANLPIRDSWQFKVLQSEWLMFNLDKWCLHSSFFFSCFYGVWHNHSKLKFSDVWMKYNEKDDVTNLLKELCKEPLCITDNYLNISEKLVLSVYPKRSSFKSIDHKRMDAFSTTPDSDLRSIPFSRRGWKGCTKRASLQSGWLSKEGKKSVASQDPLEWGWKMKNGRFVLKSQPDENFTTVEMISKICCCSTVYKNCRCSKNNVKCLIFCKCQGKC